MFSSLSLTGRGEKVLHVFRLQKCVSKNQCQWLCSIPQTTSVFWTTESCGFSLSVAFVFLFCKTNSVLIFSTSFECFSFGNTENAFWWFDWVKLDLLFFYFFKAFYLWMLVSSSSLKVKIEKYLQNLAILLEIFRNISVFPWLYKLFWKECTKIKILPYFQPVFCSLLFLVPRSVWPTWVSFWPHHPIQMSK